MRGIKNRCGWFRHNYYGSEDDLVVRFFNPIDTTFYSVAGIGDSTFFDLRGSFTEGDTVWVVPDPLPDGPPKIYTSDPGITAECGTITLAAKFLDKGEHPDFGTADEFTLVKGLVKDRLSSDGKPEAATDSSKFMKQFDWFIQRILETNIQMRFVVTWCFRRTLINYTSTILMPFFLLMILSISMSPGLFAIPITGRRVDTIITLRWN